MPRNTLDGASRLAAGALLLALHGAAIAQTDDPMLGWDCDPGEHRVSLEIFRPPIDRVAPGQEYMFTGVKGFEQCRLSGASWTLLVDIVSYPFENPCAAFDDTTVSLLRGGRLVVSSALVGYNCGHRPVLSAVRVSEPDGGADPRLELCVAPRYGEESRCVTYPLRRLKEVVDNLTLQALIRAGGRVAQ